MAVNYSELESKYGVSRRTLQRWRALGINLNSPQAIAAHIASQQCPAPQAVTAAIKEISKPL